MNNNKNKIEVFEGLSKSYSAEQIKEIFPYYEQPESRVLVIGDLHLPFEHKDYLAFCKKVYEDFSCNRVVYIGDIVDTHYSSFHNTDPDGSSAKDELEEAKRSLIPWYEA